MLWLCVLQDSDELSVSLYIMRPGSSQDIWMILVVLIAENSIAKRKVKAGDDIRWIHLLYFQTLWMLLPKKLWAFFIEKVFYRDCNCSQWHLSFWPTCSTVLYHWLLLL